MSRHAIAAAVLFVATAAWADSFYICRKAGHAQAWINEASLKAYKRQGWRCQKKMEFADTAAPRPKAGPAGEDDAGRWRPPAATLPARFGGPAGERETYEPYILEASSRYRVPANLIRAVIRVESNYHPNAVSSAGAQGLMQLMPGTSVKMGVSDAFDPRQNILGGARYLRILINRFDGDPKLSLAAYHAGPNIVESRGDIPYEQTRRYVRSVLTHFLRYKEARL